MTDFQAGNIAVMASGFIVAALLVWLLFRERRRHVAATTEVQRLAFHDALTNVPNRLLLMDRASIAFVQARRAGTKVAILFVDLDRFKIVNDSFGHDVGDGVLRAVAALLCEHLRGDDTVARIGGDEFVLLMPGVHSIDDVTRVTAKLLEKIRLPLRIGGREIFVSASIGISMFPDHASETEALLRFADAAMYVAKERGGDSCYVYTDTLAADAREELALEARLRLAVSRQEFVLHYQPRVDAETQRLVAFEALLRWNDPDRGILMPGDFIHTAEVSGLIVPIGDWVLRTACRQTARWHSEGCRELFVSVNLSPRQFNRHDLTASIADALRSAALDPQYLELEIDESCVMNNAEASMRILQELKSLGVRALISHFGSGYLSLTYLRRFPIDGLKLERSFLRLEGADDRSLAKAALGMARALHIKVIGEGVETQEAADFLRSQSCDDIQGFLVSAAVPAEECHRFISRSGGETSGMHDDRPAGEVR
jgi:diguanylate cyclase (GGDEF)-like protein